MNVIPFPQKTEVILVNRNRYILQRWFEYCRFFWIKYQFKKKLHSIDVKELETENLELIVERLSKMFSNTLYKKINVNADVLIGGVPSEEMKARRYLSLYIRCQVGCCSYAEYRIHNLYGNWKVYLKQLYRDGTVEKEFEQDALIYLRLAK